MAARGAGRTVAFWALCALAPVALLCLVAAVTGVYPFGAESFLTEDLKYQYVDFYAWFRDVLAGERSLTYSFSQGMGANTWGLYSYYLSSPLNLLVILFDEKHLTLFVFCATALRLSLMQLAMACYLRRRFGLARGWAFLLSLSWAWCGWAATQLRNPMWLDALWILPLAALACWRLVGGGRWLALAVCVAAAIICCWYMAYMMILYLILLFVLELVAWTGKRPRPPELVPAPGRAPARALPDREPGRAPAPTPARALGRTLLGRVGLLALAMGTGLALCAWTFVPTLLAMAGGSATAELGPAIIIAPQTMLRGFLPGLYVVNRTPQFYTGLAATALGLAFLGNRRIARRTRASAFALLVFVALASLLAPLEFVWSGMRVPNGFYSRTAWLVSFTGIWMAACGLSARVIPGQEGELPEKAVPRTRTAHGAPGPLAAPRTRAALMVVLCALTAAELAANAALSWFQLYTGYPQADHDAYVADASRQLLDLRSRDGSPFLRVEKTYTRAGDSALNESMALGYDGISSYASTSNPRSTGFLNTLGYSSEGEFSTGYAAANPVMDALLGVRYVYSRTPEADYRQLEAYDDGMRLLENLRALPLGFSADAAVADSPLPSGADPLARQEALVSAVLGREAGLLTPIEAAPVEQDGTLTWAVDVPAGFMGLAYVVTGPDAGDYERLALSVDGAGPVSEGWRFSHNVRSLGPAAEVAITHTVTLAAWDDGTGPRPLPTGTTCVFYALDVRALDEITAELASRSFTPEVFDDGYVRGAYHAEKDTTLLLSVPYDAGWHVTVNGVETQARPAFGGGMTAVSVRAGESVVEMRYVTPGLVPGTVVSALSALIVIGGATHAQIRKRRPRPSRDERHPSLHGPRQRHARLREAHPGRAGV